MARPRDQTCQAWAPCPARPREPPTSEVSWSNGPTPGHLPQRVPSSPEHSPRRSEEASSSNRPTGALISDPVFCLTPTQLSPGSRDHSCRAAWSPVLLHHVLLCGKVGVTCLSFPYWEGYGPGPALPDPPRYPSTFLGRNEVQGGAGRPETWPIACVVPSSRQEDTSNPACPCHPPPSVTPEGHTEGQQRSKSPPAVGGPARAGT